MREMKETRLEQWVERRSHRQDVFGFGSLDPSDLMEEEIKSIF